MATRKTLTKKADRLLRLGDAEMKVHPANGRRLLRLCRYYRRLAKQATQ